MLWRQLSGCCVVTCWLLSCFERRDWSLLPPCSILASLCMSLTLPDVCVGIQGALKAFFSFSSRQSYLFLSPLSLFLFALDLLKASVCIPKPLREVATNKEDYCLCIKKNNNSHLWSCFPEWFATHLSHLFGGGVLSPCIPEENKTVPPKAAECPEPKKNWGQNQ